MASRLSKNVVLTKLQSIRLVLLHPVSHPFAEGVKRKGVLLGANNDKAVVFYTDTQFWKLDRELLRKITRPNPDLQFVRVPSFQAVIANVQAGTGLGICPELPTLAAFRKLGLFDYSPLLDPFPAPELTVFKLSGEVGVLPPAVAKYAQAVEKAVFEYGNEIDRLRPLQSEFSRSLPANVSGRWAVHFVSRERGGSDTTPRGSRWFPGEIELHVDAPGSGPTACKGWFYDPPGTHIHAYYELTGLWMDGLLVLTGTPQPDRNRWSNDIVVKYQDNPGAGDPAQVRWPIVFVFATHARLPETGGEILLGNWNGTDADAAPNVNHTIGTCVLHRSPGNTPLAVADLRQLAAYPSPQFLTNAVKLAID